MAKSYGLAPIFLGNFSGNGEAHFGVIVQKLVDFGFEMG